MSVDMRQNSNEVNFLPPTWLRPTPSFHAQRDFPLRSKLTGRNRLALIGGRS